MDNSDDRIYPIRFGTFKLNQENRNGTIGQWVETYDRFEDRAIFVDDVVPQVDCARAYPGGRSGIFNIHDFSVNYLSVLPATRLPSHLFATSGLTGIDFHDRQFFNKN